MNKAIRLIPCPVYEVEGTEQWLSDMARAGYILTQDGIFATLAVFEKAEPRDLRYRLEASPGGTGLWSENNGEPDPEAVAINAQYAWEYVAKRGHFHIYRSAGQGRELHTDPEVQALSLRTLRKSSITNLLICCLWLVLYPLLAIKAQPLLLTLTLGSGFVLALVLLIVGDLVGVMQEFITLNRMVRQLKAGTPLAHRGEWKRSRWRYWLQSALVLALSLTAIIGILQRQFDRDAGAIALENYHEPLPFATMRDFVRDPDQTFTYDPTFHDLRFDRVILRRDVLAPVQYDWAEHAVITTEDGETVSGGLYVQYHEMRSEALAKELFREYCRFDKVDTASVVWEADREFATYTAKDLHFPALLMRKGNRVMRADFYQSADRPDIQAWFAVLMEKMQ